MLLLSTQVAAPAFGDFNPATCAGSVAASIQGVTTTNCAAVGGACPTSCGGTSSSLQNCQQPMVGAPAFSLTPQPDGSSVARWTLDIQIPWNQWSSQNGGSAGTPLEVFWYNGSSASAAACGSDPTVCPRYAATDEAVTFYQVAGLTCAGAPYTFGPFSMRAQTCGGPCSGCNFFCVCTGSHDQPDYTDKNNLIFKVTKAMLHCPEPPKSSCCDNLSCKECKSEGPGGTSVGGGGACAVVPDSGPGAILRYRAGGVGGSGWPGTGPWNQHLGRYWSHDHAERIVLDPDINHVWLITKNATFREFSGLAATGSPLRAYSTNSPSDEYRQLSYDVGTGGWQLQDLDGTVTYFLASGLWDKTVGKNPANVTQAAYSGGALASISFPDGRSEVYAYANSGMGKLASITEVGVAAGDSRMWTYLWSGDDLTAIGLPDSRSYAMFYSSDPNFPGYLTRIDLVGLDNSHRVMSAWSYDANGNVSQIWRGDPFESNPGAADAYTFSYDNAQFPTQVGVTDPFGQVTTYLVGRDVSSQKPKVTQIQGDCPTCGVGGPNATYTYGDAANPLLPTQVVDGRNLKTQYSYDPHGQVTQKLEAVGTSFLRDTNWTYHPTYHAFPILVDQPSTSGGTARRQAAMVYDSQGNLMSRTITGAESGGAFSYPTVTTYNAGGQPTSVDPPGYDITDKTTYAYDSTRGNGSLVLLSRTDPLIGATQYAYDPFNRRTQVTDVNTVATVTVYDRLNRVTSVTQKGATTTGDLVTTYAYNPLGDLFQTMLPRGNVIEYGYDAAGRLVSIERRPDAATHGERTLYTLDSVGHRTREELQHWTGSAWASDIHTDFVYSSRCHLDKTIRQDGSPSGAVTEYAYDCDDNLALVWDANHPSHSQSSPATQGYQYDALNRLTVVTQPWAGTGGGSATTSYFYDVQDHLISVTDANGNLTSYVYSDRDLLTRQVSPVSGKTDSTYNEHGELTVETDARGITTNRTVDVLDRVMTMSYPDTSLNVTYQYDTGPFAKGRLTGITRSGSTVAYTYDRFGRATQDGALGYTYDANGNRTSIAYPEGPTASYGFDFADREQSLSLKIGTNPTLPLAGPASYEPFGPLKSLPLGNGLTETRTFDGRYLPARTQLMGTGPAPLDWKYTFDPVGNVTNVSDMGDASFTQTYGYLDVNYFLTQGTGHWGMRSWTYDKIGDRLTEIRDGVTDTYAYAANGVVQTPKLRAITLGTGGKRAYFYDAAGNMVRTVDPTQQLDLVPDAANHLATLRSVPSRSYADLAYDGRGFLRQAHDDGGACVPTLTVPNYSSEGRLESRDHFNLFAPAGPALDTTLVLYLAGRPVALYQQTASTSKLTYLTTDHLGTPVVATSDTGTQLWKGGFEPFGADWSGAGVAGVFLRFPGQWEDSIWAGGLDSGLYYNLNRWYEPPTGRYTSADPISWKDAASTYIYAVGEPTLFIDSDGLAPFQNDSHIAVPYKPEEGPNPIALCLPGQTCDVDGVYPSSCHGNPIKIVDGCRGKLRTDGKLYIWCPLINPSPSSIRKVPSYFGQLLIGGPVSDSFLKRHKDWLPPNGKPFCGCNLPGGVQ
jgi:RHS repeat-associated protein